MRPKHHLGQNFLTDPLIARRIVEAAQILPEDQIVEIGPGKGVLTWQLADAARKVVAVELDERMQEFLFPLQKKHSNLEVVWGDFLKVPWEDLPLDAGPVKVVANIPYYITSPIIQKLLQADRIEKEPLEQVQPLTESIVIMVQKEVADRMAAAPGCKDYGTLSIFCQYAARIEKVLKVSAGSFYPVPKVDSTVIRLTPRRKAEIDVSSPAEYFKVVHAAFSQRRKTLSNCLLANGYEKKRIEEASLESGIDLRRRGETLSLPEFAKLANLLGSIAVS